MRAWEFHAGAVLEKCAEDTAFGRAVAMRVGQVLSGEVGRCGSHQLPVPLHTVDAGE
ncbi:hypothetical protein AB0M32_25600 [Streptomyces sp. NPDC051985]|uniref:hypothetical protein n=1 Tax=Streptomyces sp. NPDC051985 TaxID=3155807 RepID=UPI00342A7D99